jgi:hypothetical protein
MFFDYLIINFGEIDKHNLKFKNIQNKKIQINCLKNKNIFN